ncbi:hypothetical protein DFH09DRAFT_613617 [Mycena vulgaris]|nr:hypothetical protein DFH09DRAFT_613617 [Mycena vulgaris]
MSSVQTSPVAATPASTALRDVPSLFRTPEPRRHYNFLFPYPPRTTYAASIPPTCHSFARKPVPAPHRIAPGSVNDMGALASYIALSARHPTRRKEGGSEGGDGRRSRLLGIAAAVGWRDGARVYASWRGVRYSRCRASDARGHYLHRSRAHSLLDVDLPPPRAHPSFPALPALPYTLSFFGAFLVWLPVYCPNGDNVSPAFELSPVQLEDHEATR